VTAIYADGSRNTLRLKAHSLYHAVFAYNDQATSGMGVRAVRPDLNTRFEVRVVGETRIHQTS
jgi:hypothetical protein